VQLTASKRFSRNFFVQGSYTYSRLQGNYPGLFQSESGQLDPNITSQYDLIELLGNRFGTLPGDRPHQVKLDGYYTFDFGKAGRRTGAPRPPATAGTPARALAPPPPLGHARVVGPPAGHLRTLGVRRDRRSPHRVRPQDRRPRTRGVLRPLQPAQQPVRDGERQPVHLQQRAPDHRRGPVRTFPPPSPTPQPRH